MYAILLVKPHYESDSLLLFHADISSQKVEPVSQSEQCGAKPRDNFGRYASDRATRKFRWKALSSLPTTPSPDWSALVSRGRRDTDEEVDFRHRHRGVVETGRGQLPLTLNAGTDRPVRGGRRTRSLRF